MESKKNQSTKDILIKFIFIGIFFLILDIILNLLIKNTNIIILISSTEIIIMVILFKKWILSKKNHNTKIEDLLKEKEDESLEFKSSLRWDYREKKVNKELELAMIKNVAGFLNKDGGTILIGVNDDNVVLGLQEDYQTLQKKNADGFVLHLTNLLSTSIGIEQSKYITIKIDTILGKDIARIDIEPSEQPVYVKFNGIEEFYVRTSNQIKSMGIKTAHDYIKLHWKK